MGTLDEQSDDPYFPVRSSASDASASPSPSRSSRKRREGQVERAPGRVYSGSNSPEEDEVEQALYAAHLFSGGEEYDPVLLRLAEEARDEQEQHNDPPIFAPSSGRDDSSSSSASEGSDVDPGPTMTRLAKIETTCDKMQQTLDGFEADRTAVRREIKTLKRSIQSLSDQLADRDDGQGRAAAPVLRQKKKAMLRNDGGSGSQGIPSFSVKVTMEGSSIGIDFSTGGDGSNG
ncbi:hypothetical protein JCM11491_007134 [Sporobolomyces phaffii]